MDIPTRGWPLPNERERFELVAAAQLPLAHNPSSCAHHARLEALLASLPYERYDSLWRRWTPSEASMRATRQRFDQTLNARDLDRCGYHAGHWQQIAATACALVADSAAEWSFDELQRRSHADGLDEQDLRWLKSLFTHPIAWATGSAELTNGQHRACALRHSGAVQCPITR